MALSLKVEVIVAYTPATERASLVNLLPTGLHWMALPDGSLTNRLEEVAERSAALGFRPLLLIGTDSPTLPPSHVAATLRSLASDEAELALGPSRDGGFYLVGFQQPIPGLSHEVSWSTAQVSAQTLANAARLRLRVQVLPSWYDVGTPEDLLQLQHEFRHSAGARRRAPGPASHPGCPTHRPSRTS